MKYDKIKNKRRLFILNQGKLENSHYLLRSITNICDNINKIYKYALIDDDQANDEYHVFVAIIDFNRESFTDYIKELAKIGPEVDAETNRKLLSTLEYVYKAVHGLLTVSELLGPDVDTSNISKRYEQKIISVLQEIFNDHLEKLILEAEKKLTPEENQEKVKRAGKHVRALLKESVKPSIDF